MQADGHSTHAVHLGNQPDTLRLLAQLEQCVRRALERSPRTLSTDASAASCLPYRVRRLQEDQLVEWLPGAMLVSGLI